MSAEDVSFVVEVASFLVEVGAMMFGEWGLDREKRERSGMMGDEIDDGLS
jgi:hypothetical protein